MRAGLIKPLLADMTEQILTWVTEYLVCHDSGKTGSAEQAVTRAVPGDEPIRHPARKIIESTKKKAP